MNWYTIENIDRIDTPCLVLYRDRMKMNIQHAVQLVGNIDNLRPHVKTNKIAEVCKMMMDAGIRKFKCATIAEAEMLAMINARDVLLAYQPVGPKAERLYKLAAHYPETDFSCIVDDVTVARRLSEIYARTGSTLRIYIDLNTGMNRTGVTIGDAYPLFDTIKNLPSIEIAGVHAYDGHVNDPNPVKRAEKTNNMFQQVKDLVQQIESSLSREIKIVAGGSRTFPVYAERDVECSPGTFVFWDWAYKHQLPDEPFEYAALVVSRVISIVNDNTITADLGYKAVASENPLPRVYFMNAPGSKPVAQSEEHIVINVPDARRYKPGDVLYGVPVHICPTVALYERALLIENKEATTVWKVIARDRTINF